MSKLTWAAPERNKAPVLAVLQREEDVFNIEAQYSEKISKLTKGIAAGALGLTLGDRADSGVVRPGA